MENISEFFNKLFEDIQSKPQLAGCVIAGMGFFMLIAVVKDADWMLEGGNGFFNIATITKSLGRPFARILMGLICFGLIIGGFLIIYGASVSN